jgi:hypothetical protein
VESSEHVDDPNARLNRALATAISFPKIDVGRKVHAEAARLAGRMNAASISEEEMRTLLKERQLLLDKVFAKTISRKESNRLEYIRWSLDRIEDAKYGLALDDIESHVARYEHLLSELRNFTEAVDAAAGRKRYR